MEIINLFYPIHLNMLVDVNTKVILLPEGKFEIIKLPYNKDTKQFLLSNNSLYELKQIDGSNDYVAPIARLKNGVATKSLIFEPGVVMQSPNMIMATKFNFFYYLVNLLFDHQNRFNKFCTYDDLIDEIVSIVGEDYRSTLNKCEPVITTNLKFCFEVLNENNEVFYKLSVKKILQNLNNKINKIYKFINDSPESQIFKFINSSLRDEQLPVPQNILNLSILNHCIDLVFASYLNDAIKQEFLKFNSIDFGELHKYLQDLNNKKKTLSIIESNTKELITPKASKTKVVKKVKKVVKKGPLDGFFLKAK